VLKAVDSAPHEKAVKKLLERTSVKYRLYFKDDDIVCSMTLREIF
jgi:hypothetical protein